MVEKEREREGVGEREREGGGGEDSVSVRDWRGVEGERGSEREGVERYGRRKERVERERDGDR